MMRAGHPQQPFPLDSESSKRTMYSAGSSNATVDKLKKIICGCLALGVVFLLLRSSGTIGSSESSSAMGSFGDSNTMALDKAVSREVSNKL